jgi:hypothetical protein
MEHDAYIGGPARRLIAPLGYMAYRAVAHVVGMATTMTVTLTTDREPLPRIRSPRSRRATSP